ncbi:unnamed protein product [Caenorhabditis brenneri]
MPSLLETPELPIGKILKELDFLSILSLRKTCVTLRNFIDDFKPELDGFWMQIRLLQNSIFLLIQKKSTEHFHFNYQNKENGCLVSSYQDEGRKQKFIENLDFLDAFFIDFQLLMGFQNKILGRFQVELDNHNTEQPGTKEKFCEHFQKISSLIKSEDLYITTKTCSHIPSILSVFDSKYLKKVEIIGLGNEVLDTEKLEEMDQWKGLERLKVMGFPVRRLGIFKELRMVEAQFLAVDMEEIGILAEKQNTLKSSDSNILDLNLLPPNDLNNVYNHHFTLRIDKDPEF